MGLDGRSPENAHLREHAFRHDDVQSKTRRSSSSRELKIAGLLLVWYLSSSVVSLTTKEILHDFPFPITLATLQQTAAAISGWISAGLSARCHRRNIVRAVLPVAVVTVVGLVLHRWSLLFVSVAFVQTIRCLVPIFTIVFAFGILHERRTTADLVGVLPVVLGVGITTATEIEFVAPAALAALCSTACQALQAVLTKRVLAEQAVSTPELFALIAAGSWLLLLPLCLALDAWRIPWDDSQRLGRSVRWLLLNIVASTANQYAGLTVLDAMSSPLSHALANVLKRAAVISMAVIYTRRPLTPLHVLGISLSISGATLYRCGLACIRCRTSTERRPLLPTRTAQQSEVGLADLTTCPV